MLEVQYNAFLVSVQADEIGAAVFARLTGERAKFPGVVAMRWFNVEHLGTKVGQYHGSNRSGQNMRQVNDAYTFQGSRHGTLSLALCFYSLLEKPVNIKRSVSV